VKAPTASLSNAPAVTREAEEDWGRHRQ